MLPAAARQTAPGSNRGPLDAREIDSVLSIDVDGTVTIYTSKVDVGTGMRIAIAQMAADELGVPVDRITVVDGDTGQCPNHGGTGGSTGLTRGGAAVRQAAATAREALLSMAASHLDRPAAGLRIIGGEVRPASGGPGISLARLIGGRRFERQVDPKAPLLPPAQHSAIGRSPARPDVPDKCTGRYRFVQDFSVPGMLHARVIRPPAPGARLVSVDERSITAIPDTRVVRIESFLAVVAGDEWAAMRAARELKTTWTEGAGLPGHDALESYLRNGAIEREQTHVSRGADGELKPGELDAAFTSAARTFSATYFWPCQSHASLGPSSAVADVRGDGATIWTSSQVTYGMRATLARVFGLTPEKVRVVFVEGSGSYGTNGADHAAADAVLVSKTIGRPVRVQWSRQDEHGWDPKGPQQLLDLRAGVDTGGRLVAWDTRMWIPANHRGARILLAADAAGLAQDGGRDSAGIFENGDPPYAAGAVRVAANWMRDTPLNPSNLRAPGKPANVFAVEGLVDEIAAGLKIDAREFRTARLSDPRALEVIARASSSFGWDPRPSPGPRGAGTALVGRGIAYTRYKQSENYVAICLELAVDPASGAIDLRRVVCAHDCGLVVNPRALQNQIEGAIVQGLSRAVHEEVQFDRSRVTSVDWASYPILSFGELPAIDVLLVSRPDQPLWGAGEAATVPVAAAVGNAFFDATGVRLRRVPFTPARVKSALQAAAANGPAPTGAVG
jgi:CO/xanthine dehydrogenase Mo-binding subunit